MPTFANGAPLVQVRSLLNDTGLRKNDFAATEAPTATYDERFGWEVGSRILFDGLEYVCLDATTDAADWQLATDGAARAVAEEALEATAFTTPVAPLLKRPVVQRARDSVSALDLMTAGGLDSAVRNREATSADAAEITTAAQEALSACAAKQWRLDIPAGRYHMSARLTADRPVTIAGAGRDRTVLDWGSASPSAGIRIASGSGFEHASVRDLSMLTDETVPVHTAIELDYSPSISGGAISPRAQTHGCVSNVRVGSPGGGLGSGWRRGVDGISMLGLDVTDCRINGAISGNVFGNLPSSDAGIILRGAGSPVQLTVDRTYVSAMGDAVRTENAEGVYLSNFEFVNVGWGYRTDNTTGESGFAVTNGHINCLIGGVRVQNMGDGLISGTTFYHIEAGAASEIIYVQLGSAAVDITVEGNVFRRLTSDKTIVSIDITGGERANIGNNKHNFNRNTGGDLAVRIAAGASGAIVARQSYGNVVVSRQFQNASETAQFEQFIGYAGDCNAIDTTFRMPVQTHVLAAGATNYPPTWADPVSGFVQTFGYDGSLAVQVARNPRFSSGASFTRRKLTNVWSAWV